MRADLYVSLLSLEAEQEGSGRPRVHAGAPLIIPSTVATRTVRFKGASLIIIYTQPDTCMTQALTDSINISFVRPSAVSRKE